MARDAGPARRVAVVLFNLGGPDRPSAVRPFLFNLFADPAIIQVPALVRYPLALMISWLRQASAKANYARMGGASPLLPETEAQAGALQALLATQAPSCRVKTFIAMRYWRPFTAAAAREVAEFEPDEVVLLPLYPQYSTTTTASSLKAWRAAYRGSGRVRAICCYPTQKGLVEAHAQRILGAFEAAGRPEKLRLLFSAHGLPEKVIEAGDPYQSQVEATAAAVVQCLGGEWDWQVCYQSRVGPLKWIGPSTAEAIGQAAREGLGVIVTPIAFVSEHIETLVELDHDYAVLAEQEGCRPYVRVPALGLHEAFIGGLADLVVGCLNQPVGVSPGAPHQCEACYGQCPGRVVEIVR
ncbi:ferrochelatase [Phenylobacterium montanum]